jgi:hypothetical protein
VIRVDDDIDIMTDQATGHRVGVPFHLDRAAATHLESSHTMDVIESRRWEFAQAGLFLLELLTTGGIAMSGQAEQEFFVFLTIGEVATAA